MTGHPRRCFCQCHAMEGDLSYKYGVDTADPVCCVLACDECRKNHAAVLDEPPSRPLPTARWPADATGDAAGDSD